MAPSTQTFAASRRRDDGPRRVSFQESRLTSSRLYDSDGEEEERLAREEEEEERALSERFGEATESNDDDGKKRKRTPESEKDIAQELDQEEKKKVRRQRPQLLPDHLTGADGLIKLPIEMKRIKYKPKKGKKRDLAAAALYCKKLVYAYRTFCKDLMPSMNYEDVVLKIESLAVKKEVRTYVQQMRDNARNEYLERLYGREKAEKMLQELAEGLKQSEVDFDMMENEPEPRDDEPTSDDAAAADAPDSASSDITAMATRAANNDSLAPIGTEDSEQEATFDEGLVKGTDGKLESGNNTTVAFNPENEIQQSEGRNKPEDDDEEEEEATFDDVVQVDVQKPTEEKDQPLSEAKNKNKASPPALGHVSTIDEFSNENANDTSAPKVG